LDIVFAKTVVKWCPYFYILLFSYYAILLSIHSSLYLAVHLSGRSFPLRKEHPKTHPTQDGVYDNVSEEMLVRVLSHAAGISDPVKLQTYANSVALMARSLSFNPSHDSPFSRNARRHNI